MRLNAVMACAVALGCGGSSTSGIVDSNGGSGGSGSCTVTLTGAQSTTAQCTAAFEQLTGSADSEWGGVVTMEPSGFSEITASFQVAGTPTSKTYAPADFVTGGATVVTTAGKTYVASDLGSGTGTVGSLIVSGVDVAQMTGSATDYYVHGSFSATCAQQGGGSGTVMMAMSF
jgi:hypothetical protein